jgi:predicted Zn-dependent peptidase
MLQTSALKNGLKILELPKADSKTFVVGFVAQTGYLVEEGFFIPGISLLLERMILNGSSKFPSSRHVSIFLESIGASFKTKVEEENTYYILETPEHNQQKALNFITDLIQKPKFEILDLEKEKKELTESLFTSIDPFHSSSKGDYMLKYFYLNSSWESQNSYSLDAFMNIRKDQLYSYMSHQFRPDKSILLLGGKYEKASLIDQIELDWKNWNVNPKPFIEPIELKSNEDLHLPNVTYRHLGSYCTELKLGFLIHPNPWEIFSGSENGELGLNSDISKLLPQYLLAYSRMLVLNSLLGAGVASKLWSKGIEEEMAFSEIGSNFRAFKHSQFLEIVGLTENTQFSLGLEIVLQVLDNLKKTTVSLQEISRAKEMVKGSLIFSQEKLMDRLLWEVNSYLCTGLIFDLDELLEILNRVQALEVRSLSMEIFNSNRLSLQISGPAKETRLIEKLIDRYLN